MACQDTLKREEKIKFFWTGIQPTNALFERKLATDFSRPKTGYLYCVICDSKMDTEIMWGNHIKGNRHFINSTNFEYSYEEPSIQKELDKETRAMAGLDHIYEISLTDNFIVYQCLLCPAGLMTSKSLMKHIMGLAHQMVFLKDNLQGTFSRLNSELTRSELKQVVQKKISKYERKHGRGKMFVMKAKKSPGNYILPYKNHSVSAKYKWINPKYSNNFPLDKPIRYSPMKSARKKEENLESEWKNLLIGDGSEKAKDKTKTYISDVKISNSIEPKYEVYRRGLSKKDSRFERDNYYNPERLSRFKDSGCKDLRAYLNQKRNIKATKIFEKSSMDVSAYVSNSSEISHDSDELLRFFEDVSPELFLRLVVFKLEKMDVKKEIELKLLSYVANKATELFFLFKKNNLAENV